MAAAYDGVVVGSGPNGLSAAIVLASAGRSVLVVERAERLGGGLRSDQLTVPGYVHDVCSTIHALAAGSPFFSTLPLAEHGVEWAHPDFCAAHPLDDEPAAVLERSVEATADALDDDAAAYRRVFRSLANRFDDIAADALAPRLRIPARPVRFASFGLDAVRSARAIAARFSGRRARALWAGIAAHVALPLEGQLTAGPGLLLAAAGHAVGWPVAKGGSQSLADGLVSYLRSLGGEVETGRPVRTMSDVPPARAVLFDVTPGQLAAIAGDRLPRRYLRGAARFRHGPGAFKLDYALDGPVPWLDERCRRAGTIHLGGTYEEVATAERLVHEGRHPERPYVLVVQPTVFDPTRAPPGGHTLWAYCHVPNGSTVDMTSAIESQIERFAPGFRERIVARYVAGPARLQERNPNLVGGDVGGGSVDGLQLLLRPFPGYTYGTGADGVFLCSSSTPPGGGAHGMCGYHAARRALATVLS